jgi:hypothetical protein
MHVYCVIGMYVYYVVGMYVLPTTW